MSKNDKKNRTDGTITSSGMKIPNPIKSFNSPSSEFKDVKEVHLSETHNQLK